MELIRLPISFESLGNNLMETMPSIYAIAIIDKDNEIVYSTDNWDISTDIENICSSWDYKNASFIMVSGIKYTMLDCEIDSMVATSIRGQGHIVGCKDEERRIITYVEPKGDRKAAVVEISRILAKMSSKKPDIEEPHIVPELKKDIEDFLAWIKNPYGLPSYIKFYLEKNNRRVISELARIYEELIDITTF
ncbi:hypothetical protein ES703_52080 [subsurface metagenome]